MKFTQIMERAKISAMISATFNVCVGVSGFCLAPAVRWVLKSKNLKCLVVQCAHLEKYESQWEGLPSGNLT